MKERNIIILDKKFSIADMPDWMYRLDHGTNLITGYADVFVSNKKIYKRLLEFFKKKKIKIKILK